MIAVYVSPVALDQATYEKVGQRLDEAGAPITGRTHHSCFGEQGNLMVYEVCESQEAYDAFSSSGLVRLRQE